MTDKELQHLLPDYFDGRLDDAIRREIEQRLEASADMRNALDAAKLYTEAVASIDPIRASDDFLDKVHRRIGEKQGLFDRLFRPFHIKLPIELAGVAVTVVLVVLLYNPFSGKLPQQVVEERRESQHYFELQEPSAVLEPASAAESQPVPPVAMERPASAVAEKKALRRSIAGSASTAGGSGKTETLSSYASNTTTPAAKSAPRAMASTPMTNEPAYDARPSASPPPAPQPEDGSAGMAGALPAAAKEAPAELAASALAAEYESSVNDAAPEHQKETLRYSSNVRAEERTAPARKMVRPAIRARKAASESKQTVVQDSPADSVINQITDLVNRYHGTIETVPAERNDVVRLKLTIPSKKFGAFKEILSTDIKVASITDTISASGRSDLTIILEVKPAVGDR